MGLAYRDQRCRRCRRQRSLPRRADARKNGGKILCLRRHGLSDRLSRAQLARAAGRLGTGPLPTLVLMTDDDTLPDPLAAARALTRGSMVVARSRDAGRLDRMSRALLKMARRNGFAVLIAGDPLLAA